ncbi:hypothetical protein [Streptomyces nigrescens]|uniref:hypothetical protein n=1 Tax=Streptomyces nigrescens TaxID=1920 RepID=UPI0036FA30A7
MNQALLPSPPDKGRPAAVLYGCLNDETPAVVLGRLETLTRRRLQLTPYKSYADIHNRDRLGDRKRWWYVEQLLTERVTVHLVVSSLDQVAHRLDDQRALYRWCAKTRVELHLAAPAAHSFTFDELADGSLDVLIALEKAHQFAHTYTRSEDIVAAINDLKGHLHEHVARASRRLAAIPSSPRSEHPNVLRKRIRRAERVLGGPTAKYPKGHLEVLAAAVHGLLPEESLRGWNDPWTAARGKAE